MIGKRCGLKGQQPIGLAVLKTGIEPDHQQLEQDVVAMVRQQIGPVASFKTLKVVQRLPKTRSGKILRGTLRKIADGENFNTPATIDDPAILEEIRSVFSDD